MREGLQGSYLSGQQMVGIAGSEDKRLETLISSFDALLIQKLNR